MKKDNQQKNIDTVREILRDEVEGRVQSALDNMSDEYKMTWVYKRRDGVLFPSEKINKNEQLENVYKIQGREYRINHILADDNVVMAEMSESYPDPKTGKIYRTPMMMVWEFENGKIKCGRHYCDPQLSYENLSEDQINSLY
jgi:ketosteroid isomerase-like protein